MMRLPLVHNSLVFHHQKTSMDTCLSHPPTSWTVEKMHSRCLALKALQYSHCKKAQNFRCGPSPLYEKLATALRCYLWLMYKHTIIITCCLTLQHAKPSPQTISLQPTSDTIVFFKHQRFAIQNQIQRSSHFGNNGEFKV